jgi:hypothetical protein
MVAVKVECEYSLGSVLILPGMVFERAVPELTKHVAIDL